MTLQIPWHTLLYFKFHFYDWIPWLCPHFPLNGNHRAVNVLIFSSVCCSTEHLTLKWEIPLMCDSCTQDWSSLTWTQTLVSHPWLIAARHHCLDMERYWNLSDASPLALSWGIISVFSVSYSLSDTNICSFLQYKWIVLTLKSYWIKHF